MPRSAGFEGVTVERFGAALAAVHSTLDWMRLGHLYCHEGGEDFFPPGQREAIQDAGLELAGDLGGALDLLPTDGPRQSLYFGAALAELAPILFEHLVARRDVRWHNLPGPETDELNRVLALVETTLDLPLPRVSTDQDPARVPIDHLWCVSVLTDPETFPALHDELYERRGTELAVGAGDPARERARAEGIVDELVGTLAPHAVLSTSDEELPFFTQACAARGLELEVPDRGVTSPIVGDVVRTCRVQPASSS